jgi:predicted Zn-dependent protease
MKKRILQTLDQLRNYGLTKGCDISIFYHEEDSTLMRFANSAISLNTNEHLVRLEITAATGRKRASYAMITDLNQLEAMKRGIDIAVEMVDHVQALEYDPTVPVLTESFTDESGYDPALAEMTNDEKLAFFNQSIAGLETEQLRLSGIFSSGVNTVAQINTTSEHTQFFCTTDAQVTIVLAHEQEKWEVQAEQSAQKKMDLNAQVLHDELEFLVRHFTSDRTQQLPLGKYDIVFGQAAIADMLSIMNWVGFSGGTMKRGYSFLNEEQIGKKVLSSQFNLVDDTSRRETFPFKRDYYGIRRDKFPIFKEGIFQSFTWVQDDADEFGERATGHTVHHKSLVLHGGQDDAASLASLVAKERDKDLLYIPFLHYMNLVNPSRGIITASSRFGALLLKKDGSVVVPFNVRLTQSLLEIFGDKVAWLSRQTSVYNTSSSYGARNPTAVVVPCFMRVNDLEISHANASF